MLSFDHLGVVAVIIGTVVAIIGLVRDRRRKTGAQGSAANLIQNFYVTPDDSGPLPAAGDSEADSKEDGDKQPDDVHYVLLLEACTWLAADLYLVGITHGAKLRMIKLIERHLPELRHDAGRFSRQLDAGSPGTAQIVGTFVSGTLPQYVSTMKGNVEWLKAMADGARESEQQERERKSAHYTFGIQQDEISERLRANHEYDMALARQSQDGVWEVLGFDSRGDFDEYVQPTMRSLTSSPGDLEEDTLRSLLEGPLSAEKMQEEDLPESVRVELMNRLLADKWAKFTSAGQIVLTDAGERLLRRRLASWA